MSKQHDNMIQQIAELFLNLPGDYQNAILWLIKNISWLQELCKESPLTPQQRQTHLAALDKKDNALVRTLLEFEQQINGNSK